jgi:hypothetical protein
MNDRDARFIFSVKLGHTTFKVYSDGTWIQEDRNLADGREKGTWSVKDGEFMVSDPDHPDGVDTAVDSIQAAYRSWLERTVAGAHRGGGNTLVSNLLFDVKSAHTTYSLFDDGNMTWQPEATSPPRSLWRWNGIRSTLEWRAGVASDSAWIELPQAFQEAYRAWIAERIAT